MRLNWHKFGFVIAIIGDLLCYAPMTPRHGGFHSIVTFILDYKLQNSFFFNKKQQNDEIRLKIAK